MGDVYARLRAEMLALERRHPNEPYPAHLKRRATRAAVELRARGMTWRLIGEALGISADSARKWHSEQTADEGRSGDEATVLLRATLDRDRRDRAMVIAGIGLS